MRIFDFRKLDRLVRSVLQNNQLSHPEEKRALEASAHVPTLLVDYWKRNILLVLLYEL